MDTDYYSSSYMGPKADKLKSQSFNVFAFLLGPIYFAYRKLFLQGFLILMLMLVFPVLGTAVGISALGALSLLVSILGGFLFPKMYRNEAARKVSMILSSNPNMPDEACRKAGGTSVGKALLMLLLEIVLIVIVTVLSSVLAIGKVFTDVVETVSNGPETYDGMTVYDTSAKLDEIVKFSVPDYFEDETQDDFILKDATYEKKFNAYFENEEDPRLELTVGIINISSDVKIYAKSHQEYNKDSGYTYSSKPLGEITWEIVKSTSSLNSTAYASVNDRIVCVELKPDFFADEDSISLANADKLFEQILGTFTADTSSTPKETKFIGLEKIFVAEEENVPDKEDEDTNTISNTAVESTNTLVENTAVEDENTNTTTTQLSESEYQALKDDILEKSPRLKVEDFINIDVSNDFQQLADGSVTYIYNLSDSRECSFEVTMLRKYTNIESLLEAINGVGDKMALGTMPTNDIDWNTQVCFNNDDSDAGIMYLWAEINDYVVQIKVDYGKSISDDTEISNLNAAFVAFVSGITKK